MRTSTVSLFFAILALACWAGVGVLVVAAVSRRAGSRWAADLLDDVGEGAAWLAWIVALVATAGSLYYSEVAHFVPCALCWFQRIAIYPMSVILLVGAVRRDRTVGWYVLPLALVGLAFSVYHTQLQAFPDQGASSFCTTSEPCTIRYVWELGFVSLPFMALSGLALITALMVVQLARGVDPTGPDEAEDPSREEQLIR